ncbi:MAG: sigma-70 family RNA polymerase sigma factor [Myxococcota bacterium]
MSDVHAELGETFRRHERLLWGLSYRMTGSAADADEIVQETFARALAHPPEDRSRSLRPWLVRVAMNLARDALRRRRRQPYVGPWLPEPIETPAGWDDGVPGARYEMLESVTFAFLLALEVLTPKQRAVLLLRDVMDCSVRETAGILELTEGHVKVLHHRARAALRAYDAERRPPRPEELERTSEVLRRFMTALLADDARALASVLAEDVVTLNDGAGEFHAARRPVVGRERVMRFHRRIRRLYQPSADDRIEVRNVNGLPAVVARFAHVRPGSPPRQVMFAVPGADGRIRRIGAVLASSKLRALFGE